MNPDQKNALENLRHFLKVQGNTITISRRDAAILLRLLDSWGEKPQPSAVPDPTPVDSVPSPDGFCLYCHHPFTADAPAGFSVPGKGKLHVGCAEPFRRLLLKQSEGKTK